MDQGKLIDFYQHPVCKEIYIEVSKNLTFINLIGDRVEINRISKEIADLLWNLKDEVGTVYEKCLSMDDPINIGLRLINKSSDNRSKALKKLGSIGIDRQEFYNEMCKSNRKAIEESQYHYPNMIQNIISKLNRDSTSNTDSLERLASRIDMVNILVYIYHKPEYINKIHPELLTYEINNIRAAKILNTTNNEDLAQHHVDVNNKAVKLESCRDALGVSIKEMSLVVVTNSIRLYAHNKLKKSHTL